MNVHVSYRLHKIPAVEKDFQHQIEKLQKRLQVFRPELIHLKGVVEEVSAREGTSVSLNLRLPSAQVAARKARRQCAAERCGARSSVRTNAGRRLPADHFRGRRSLLRECQPVA